MKKHIFKTLPKILLALAFMGVVYVFAFADVGNFNSYGGGGGWSGGGGGSYSGGGYSSGGSGGSGLFFIMYLLVEEPLLGMLFLAVIAAFIIGKIMLDKAETSVFGSHAPRKDGQNMGSYSSYNGMRDNSPEIATAIWGIDPDFSVDKFLGWVKEVFITLQMAWFERDWEKVRPFEKEELYRQHELQIKEYIMKGRINVIERINVNNAYLFKYKRDSQYEYLTVFMNVRMIDYIIDERTKEVLKGDPNRDCYLQYMLTFIRKTGVLTSSAKSTNSAVACPKCGAPTKITSAGKCEYCGFIITTGEYNWVLADIEGVKPSVDYGRGGVEIKDKGDK